MEGPHKKADTFHTPFSDTLIINHLQTPPWKVSRIKTIFPKLFQKKFAKSQKIPTFAFRK